MKKTNRKIKGKIKIGLLAITFVLSVAVLSGAVGGAQVGTDWFSNISSQLVPGSSNETFTFVVENNHSTKIDRFGIQAPADFVLTDCDGEPAGWSASKDVNGEYCYYEFDSHPGGLADGEDMTLNVTATTHSVSAYYNFTVKQRRDDANDWDSEIHKHAVEVDADGPSITIYDPEKSAWYKNQTIVNHTESDTNDVDACKYKINDGGWLDTNCDEDFSLDTSVCSDGTDTCTLDLWSNDTLGNNNTKNVTFSVDNSLPTINNINLSSSIVKTGDKINITSDGTDEQGVYSCTMFLKNTSSKTADNEGYKPMGSDCDLEDYTIPAIADGDYYIGIRVRNNADDADGDKDDFDDEAWAWENITIDSTEPNLTITKAPSVDYITAPFDLNATVDYGDAGLTTGCEVYWIGNKTGTLPFVDNNDGTGYCGGQVDLGDAEGDGTLLVKVTDEVGLSGNDSRDYTYDVSDPYLKDKTPPSTLYKGEDTYSVKVCDDGSGVNKSTIGLKIRDKSEDLDWLTQGPSITADGDCYIVNGTLQEELRYLGNTYEITVSAEDDTGKTLGGGNTWEYTVSDEYTIDLSYGKNYIASPLIPEDTNISVVFSDIRDDIEKVYKYDPAAGGNFRAYYPDNLSQSDLHTFEDGIGYIVYANKDTQLVIKGVAEEDGAPKLYAFNKSEMDGEDIWNFVGFRTTDVEPIKDRIYSGEIADELTTWDEGWEYVQKTSNLTVSRAYWMYGIEAGRYR